MYNEADVDRFSGASFRNRCVCILWMILDGYLLYILTYRT